MNGAIGPHPLAGLLPMLNDVEFQALVADIREHGLRVPITLFDGQVLDGRNRLKACTVAGVEPHFEVFTGTEDDALAFVLSLNVARRHLTTPQRAVVALRLLPLEEERAAARRTLAAKEGQDFAGAEGRAIEVAGKRVGVSSETVRQAARLAEHAPDVIAAMSAGTVKSMPEAQRLAHIPATLRATVTKRLRSDGGRVNDALRAVRSEEQAQRVEKAPEPVVAEAPGVRLIYGQHVIDALRSLADESVQMVATSPPYFALRDYGGTPTVWGGDSSGNCSHEWGEHGPDHHPGQVEQTKWKSAQAAGNGQTAGSGQFCSHCGAWRGHLGLEPTPRMYVAHMVEVFHEIRRVLRPDGVVWLNLGDSYNNRSVARPSSHQAGLGFDNESIQTSWADHRKSGLARMSLKDDGLKEKDLVGIPWRVALALQDAGWWLRSDIVWSKLNPLPEPVTDRPTRAHEYVFLLTKSKTYFYDADAIREPFTDPRPKVDKRGRQRNVGGLNDGHTQPHGIDPRPHAGRNRRSVWTLPTQPYAEAHFATFPEALVEPMILAGTSAAGACKSCRAPWVREVERRDAADGSKAHTTAYGEAARTGKTGRQVGVEAKGSAGNGFATRDATTTGWRPSCECGVDAVVPSTVLDPFSGSATTGKVARDHGRSYIGIDLNADYLPLAKTRIGIE